MTHGYWPNSLSKMLLLMERLGMGKGYWKLKLIVRISRQSVNGGNSLSWAIFLNLAPDWRGAAAESERVRG